MTASTKAASNKAASNKAASNKAPSNKSGKVDWSDARIKGRLPPRLSRCPGPECGQYIYPQHKKCPHCGGTLVVLKKKQLAAIAKAEKALATLKAILGET